jgi:hypothetical protein
MCFSATASFAASLVLLLCSFFTLKKASAKQRLFAAIPLLFAIQQFIEGMIWRTLTDYQDATVYAYAYLIFVFIVWPLWIPYSIRFMNNDKKERALLRLPILAGAIVALITLAHIGSIDMTVSITGNHIHYSAPIDPSLITITTLFYLFATISPFFMIRVRYARIMGTILAISYGASYYFYSCHIISVWCFFSAILSALTLLIIR